MPDQTTSEPDTWPTAYPEGYAVVDVETTGLARDDRIVSAAVYRLDSRGNVVDHWYTLVNPERDPGPVWIHGLTSRMLRDAPLFPEIADELSSRLEGRVLVAHHAVFDWSMISREYARAEREAPSKQRLCTIHLSKDLALPLPNYRLESLAAHYGVVQRRAHHALDDARVLAEVFRPSLHLAASTGLPLPLHACRPLAAPPAPRTAPEASTGPGLREGQPGAARHDAAGEDGYGSHAAYGSYGARGTSGTPGPVPSPSTASPAASPAAAPGAPVSASAGWRGWRPARKRPACPHRNPGRLQSGGTLAQGMRVAFSGDTSIDREDLEDRATEAGLHVASSVSKLTSLLVTNDPDAFTTKVRRAREVGTPVVSEAAFVALLDSVRPAPDPTDTETRAVRRAKTSPGPEPASLLGPPPAPPEPSGASPFPLVVEAPMLFDTPAPAAPDEQDGIRVRRGP